MARRWEDVKAERRRLEEIGPYVDDLDRQSAIVRAFYWLDVFGRRDDRRRRKMIQRQRTGPPPHPTHDDPTSPDYPRPVVSPRMLERWRGYRICVKVDGGHFWHPIGMIDWECCQCGIQIDGSPKDGKKAGVWA